MYQKLAKQKTYTRQDQVTWTELNRRLRYFHDIYACRDYMEAKLLAETKIDEVGRIPELDKVSKAISETASFRLQPVENMIGPEQLFSYLSKGLMSCTGFIRPTDQKLNTPSPDLIHDLIGHVYSLFSPKYQKLYRLFGELGKDADSNEIVGVDRIYWHTMEFGAVLEEGRIKVYGAGFLSSIGQLKRLKHNTRFERFDIEKMRQTGYNHTIYQKRVFLADSLEQVISSLTNIVDLHRGEIL